MAEPEFILADTDPASRRSDPARNLAVVVYILQALSFFVGGITGLVGVIIKYVKLDDVRNTWVERHFRWQIRPFWIGHLGPKLSYDLRHVLRCQRSALWVISACGPAGSMPRKVPQYTLAQPTPAFSFY